MVDWDDAYRNRSFLDYFMRKLWGYGFRKRKPVFDIYGKVLIASGLILGITALRQNGKGMCY